MMHRRISASFILALMLVPLFTVFIVIPPIEAHAISGTAYTINTSSLTQATGYAGEPTKLVYDGSKFWAFYCDSTDIYYEYSYDGASWNNTRQSAGVTTSCDFQLYYVEGGSNIYLFRVKPTNNPVLTIGTISGETISWGAEKDFGTTTSGRIHSVIKLTNGRLFVTWAEADDSRDDFSNSTDNGVTWKACSAVVTARPIGDNGGGCGTTANSGPTGADGQTNILSGGKAIHFNTGWGAGFGYTLWNGTHWLLHRDFNFTLDSGSGGSFVARTLDNTIDIVYRLNDQTIWHKRGLASTNAVVWESANQLKTAMSGNDKGVAAGYDNNGTLYAAYPASKQSTNNRTIFYKTFDGATWSSQKVWANETQGSITNTSLIMMPLAPIGINNYPALMWVLNANSTNYVRISAPNGTSPGAPPPTTNETIPTDFDPYLFVNKWYNISQTVQYDGSSISVVQLKFSDGYQDLIMSYNNETNTFSTNDANYLVLDTHSSKATETVNGTIRRVDVNYIVKLTNLVQDAEDVDVYRRSNSTDGFSTGWVLALADNFDIYNHGGIIESLSSGDAGRTQGGDTFEMWAEDGGWVAVNQTWYHLVQYHTQFAIEFSGASDSNDQFMQDCGHYFIPTDKWCSDKGDWQLFISWYYFDQTNMSNKGYVKGWTAWIQMETGNTNQNNHWTSLNVTWFDSQGATVRSDLVWAYAEPPESNQVKIWLDLWFNKVNASTVHGGRVSPVYYGVTFSGFLWWGTFGPLMQNSTQSMLFDENIGKDDVTVVPAQFLEMSKVMFNLTRPTSNILAEDMKVTLKNFDISEFKTTDGRVLGIDTPIYVYPKIPDMPVEGFFAPLYKAISMIGQYIQDAWDDAMKVIWDGINARWPWFAQFWSNMIGSITAIADVFNTIWTYVVSFFIFLGSIIGYISYPFQVLAQAWSYVQQMFSWISGADLQNLIIIFIIIFVFIPILQALYAGNWDFIINFARGTWAVAHTTFSIFTTVVKIVIDFVMDMIPS